MELWTWGAGAVTEQLVISPSCPNLLDVPNRNRQKLMTDRQHCTHLSAVHRKGDC